MVIAQEKIIVVFRQIQYVLKYFYEFINLVECVVDQMNFWGCNAGHGPLLAVAVQNVAETVVVKQRPLILSSGGHNFPVLCILSSGNMSYNWMLP